MLVSLGCAVQTWRAVVEAAVAMGHPVVRPRQRRRLSSRLPSGTGVPGAVRYRRDAVRSPGVQSEA